MTKKYQGSLLSQTMGWWKSQKTSAEWLNGRPNHGKTEKKQQQKNRTH